MSRKSKKVKEIINIDEIKSHRVVNEWNKVCSEKVIPSRIQILKKHIKTVVYRIEGAGPRNTSIIAKRSKNKERNYERIFYEEIAPQVNIPDPGFITSVEDDEGFVWLFMKDAGDVAFKNNNLEHRDLAAKWLADLHISSLNHNYKSRLREINHEYYFKELTKARRIIIEKMTEFDDHKEFRRVLEKVILRFNYLESCWNKIENICYKLPQTIVHGDMVSKNLRVTESHTGSYLIAFDWEGFGWGVPAIDFATTATNPDVYLSYIREIFPSVSLQAINETADAGIFFRYILTVSWTVEYLKFCRKPMEEMKYKGFIQKVISDFWGIEMKYGDFTRIVGGWCE